MGEKVGKCRSEAEWNGAQRNGTKIVKEIKGIFHLIRDVGSGVTGYNGDGAGAAGDGSGIPKGKGRQNNAK